MKSVIYGICMISYLIGLLLLVNILFDFQNTTLNNTYYSVLFPFCGLFLIGFYFSLLKLFKKVHESNLKVKISKANKLFGLLIGIIFLLMLTIKFSFNPFNFMVIIAFIGYGISLFSGYQLIKVEKVKANSN
ncbi:hypothetical protein [Rummeliibacillus pycnus]|uniref:hypothetical protein n=1 Tax=Rummeliibacillus pycnus TaxID=101070 RepID=UPI003D275CC5